MHIWNIIQFGEWTLGGGMKHKLGTLVHDMGNGHVGGGHEICTFGMGHNVKGNGRT